MGLRSLLFGGKRKHFFIKKLWKGAIRLVVPALLLSITWMLVFSLPAQAQEQEVSGQVTAEDGQPLPGVNVVVRGTSTGTTTNAEGSYSLTVPSPQDTLVYSFVGYVTEEVPVEGRSVIDVTMRPSTEALEEVVVVGYGEQQRADVTSAISQVSSEDLEDVQATSIGESLQGLAPGVQVTSAGSPGQGAIVRIRGLSSTNTNEPLYVVDGVPTGGIEALNPNDIQSIEVLKDASAAAIYGSRAANGVVLISTKSGQAGEMRVTFNSSVGYQNVPENQWLDLLNTEQYVNFFNDRIGNPPANVEGNAGQQLIQNNQYVDWQDAVFRTGLTTNNTVAVSGGSETAQYRVSLGYTEEEGAVIETGFERYSMRVNSNFDVGRFTISENLSLSHSTRNPMRTQEPMGVSDVTGLATRYPPYIQVRDSTNPGGWNGPMSGDAFDDPNPVRVMENGYEEYGTSKLVGNVTAEARIVEGLTFQQVLGMDAEYQTYDYFERSYDDGDFHTQLFAEINEQRYTVFSPISTTTLNFDRTFGAHELSAITGYEVSVTRYSELGGSGDNSLTDEIEVPGSVSGDVVSGIEGTDVLQSMFGRVTYNYDGRYLLQGALRRDGYSRFGPDNKYGIFPSGSVGWVLSEEAFLSDVSALSNLKLRGSYGLTGNNQALDRYEYQSTVATGFEYPFAGTTAQGASIVGLSNRTLRWEKTSTLNIGVDLGLFDQAFTFTGEYYQNTTEDILLQVTLPPSFGFAGDPRSNTGEVQASGFEFQAGYQSQGTGDLNWSVNANFSTANNEVVSLGAGNPITGATWQQAEGTSTRIAEGQPIWYFYGYEVDRLFQPDDFDSNGDLRDEFANHGGVAPGDIKFVNRDGDEDIDVDDKTKIGSPHPDYYYGLTGNVNWKNFDVGISLQGAAGHQILRDYAYWIEGMQRESNYSTKVLDAWTPQNTDTNVPRAVLGSGNNNRISSRWISDGDYLRIQRVTLGYALPLNLTTVRRARIYVQAENLYTFTGYPGYDPEVGARDTATGDQSRGIDTGQYVKPRAFRVGVNLDF